MSISFFDDLLFDGTGPFGQTLLETVQEQQASNQTEEHQETEDGN